MPQHVQLLICSSHQPPSHSIEYLNPFFPGDSAYMQMTVARNTNFDFSWQCELTFNVNQSHAIHWQEPRTPLIFFYFRCPFLISFHQTRFFSAITSDFHLFTSNWKSIKWLDSSLVNQSNSIWFNSIPQQNTNKNKNLVKVYKTTSFESFRSKHRRCNLNLNVLLDWTLGAWNLTVFIFMVVIWTSVNRTNIVKHSKSMTKMYIAWPCDFAESCSQCIIQHTAHTHTDLR